MPTHQVAKTSVIFLGGGVEKMLVWIDSNGLRLEVYQPGHQVESSGSEGLSSWYVPMLWYVLRGVLYVECVCCLV